MFPGRHGTYKEIILATAEKMLREYTQRLSYFNSTHGNNKRLAVAINQEREITTKKTFKIKVAQLCNC